MSKPLFVQDTVTYTSAELVDRKVNDKVNDLLDQGYHLRVIVHEPVMDVGPANSFMIYATTILATKTTRVDIGWRDPKSI